jgi:hypothetical protein
MKPFWCFIFLSLSCLFSGLAFAQTPGPESSPAKNAASPRIEGVIVAKRVTGTVRAVNNATNLERVLKNDDRLHQGETVITEANRDSSIILVFSNGASIQLKSDSKLNIQEFLQDSWENDIEVKELSKEPGTSQTKLDLARGELIGKVAKLNRDKGSSFSVQTPLGAAGIRGTTFRIVFRPDPVNPLKYAVFSLSTLEGNVELQQNVPGTGGAAPAGVSVPDNKEVVITVEVNVDATTNAITITQPPTVVQSATVLSSQTVTEIQQAAVQVAIAASEVTITTPAPGTPSGTSGTGTGTGSGSGSDGSQTGGEKSGDTSGIPAAGTLPVTPRLTTGDGNPG